MKVIRKINKKPYSCDRSDHRKQNCSKIKKSRYGHCAKNYTFSQPSEEEKSRHSHTLTQLNEEVRQLKMEVDFLNRQMIQNNRAHQVSLEQMDRAFRTSLSFRIGWVLTKPFRWLYDFWKTKRSNSPLTNRKKNYENEKPEVIASLFDRAENLGDFQSIPALSVDKEIWRENRLAEVTAKPNAKPTILFITPNLPDFDQSSGGKRGFRLIKTLSGFAEVSLFTAGEKQDRHRRKLAELQIDIIEFSEDPIQIKLKYPHFDVLIFAWYYSYLDHFQFVSLYPNAKTVIDSVDVHWVRERRSLGYQPDLSYSVVNRNKKSEKLAYSHVDQIWVVTEEDKTAIHQELPLADIRLVSNIHSIELPKFEKKDNPKILFFGGYLHSPNLSAVLRLAKEIFPLIRKEVPDVELLLAGSKAPEEVRQLDRLPGVKFIGFIKESEIKQLYQSVSLTIVPLLSGAGIKGKICEAICYRIPVLTNKIGNEGINLVHGVEGFVCETNNEFAEQAIDILLDKYDLEKITDLAVEKISRIVSPDLVKSHILKSLFPKVSISIVSWNRLELLRKCLLSILNHTYYPNYRILIHSNGCTDGTREYLRELAQKDTRIEPILSDTNEVFVRPNNRMMELYPESDVVLLNNDVEVSPGWLMGLYRAAYLSDEIGISGSKLLYPDGTLQEFGSELHANGSGRNIGKFGDPTLPEFNQLSQCGYVSGCAMYIKRSTIEKIGTFDDQFHPCYCEDSDFCYTAKEHGLVTVVTPNSVVYHHEGATSGTDTSSGFKTYQTANMEKFLKKHRGKPNGIDWGRNN